MKRSLPGLLILFRLVLGILLLADATDKQTGLRFVLALSAGVASDVLDGVVARKFGIVTDRLREADSWVDAWFVSCVLASAWLAHREAIHRFLLPIAVMVAFFALSQLVAWSKYRRFAAYHAYSARLAGALLYLAAIQLFGYGIAGWVLSLGIFVAILSHVERIAITVALPRWRHDIPSVWHGLRMRHALRQS